VAQSRPRPAPRPPGGGPAPGGIAVVASKNIGGEGQMGELVSRTTLQGMVINDLMSMGPEERGRLPSHYPGANFQGCLVVQEGRSHPGPAWMVAMFGGGALSILAGIGLFFYRRYLIVHFNLMAYEEEYNRTH